MQIETENLIIRNFKPADEKDLCEYMLQRVNEKFEAYPWFTAGKAHDEVLSRSKSDESFAIELKKEKKVIGNIYLGKRDFNTQELGSVLNKKYQRKGFGTEACKAAIDYAFRQHVHRIYAETSPEHIASWKLMEKIGLKREAHLRKNVSFHNDANGNPVYWDTYIYAALNPDEGPYSAENESSVASSLTDSMPFVTHIPDFVYPKTLIVKIRNTSRGIIIRDDCIALMHIVGEDKFGDRDHWETPGGGIEDGETLEEALHREIQEELGCTIRNIKPIGIISNDYNLISRCDRAHFFLADAGTFSTTQYTENEKALFREVDWIPIREIVSRYEQYSVTAPDGTKTGVRNCGRIIHKRDLIMIKRALEMM